MHVMKVVVKAGRVETMEDVPIGVQVLVEYPEFAEEESKPEYIGDMPPKWDMLETIEHLRRSREREMDAAADLANARAMVKFVEGQLEARRKAVVVQAYVDGKIDGKNAETRKAQEEQKAALDTSMPEFDAKIREATAALADAERVHAYAKVLRQYSEDRLEAMHALLAADSGHIRLSDRR